MSLIKLVAFGIAACVAAWACYWVFYKSER
jgi:hypothetical protein